MINAHIDPLECEFSEEEIDAAKAEIAAEKWHDMNEDAREFLMDSASTYIVDLVRGGDVAAEALKCIERDALGYLAEWVPTDKAIRRLR